MGFLEDVCSERKAAAAAARRARPPSSLVREADPPRPAFVPGESRVNRRTAIGSALLIAECKKASPSRGLIAAAYDPASLARAYERGGAGMVSVLTEPRRFMGSESHLRSVRASVAIPVLRKDFIIDPYQVDEAWAMGADAILLILAALDLGLLKELVARSRELSLSVLAELHGEEEIGAAVEAGVDAVGVNARDLRSLEVDPSLHERLFPLLPRWAFAVAESGIATPDAAGALIRVGYRGLLVGEVFSSSSDPEATVRSFVSAIRPQVPNGGLQLCSL
jgi:indole-3-glycerol phosphate synthase